MKFRFDSPWHKQSFDNFLSARLPELLAERLPLAGYQVEPGDAHTCRVRVELSGNGHTGATAVYEPIPVPDALGQFWFSAEPRVVVVLFDHDNLEQAQMHCVGERLYEAIQPRLAQIPSGLAWDEGLLRALLPLDEWINTFLQENAQWLDTTNWGSRRCHLRRIVNLKRKTVIDPSERGLVDPFETPEGPNIGKIFTIAAGAEIRAGRLVRVDDSPEGALGHDSLMVPFLEHNDPNRLLMGVNMMRQAVAPPDPEPALVQTGYEPDESSGDIHDLWCGRNLLTAFIDGGEATALDGIILSQSAVRRLNYPYPAGAGDKLANRHGTKGVVAQVLPDEQMPHLADGTPVELVYSFYGLHTRMFFGQVREAIMGRIARAEGKPAIVPPFAAPSAEELRHRLVQAGLPEDGMEHLRWGADGAPMPLPSTVGWVYWYRLAHLAEEKLRVSMDGTQGQVLSEVEISALCQAGAYINAAEALGLRSIRHPQAQYLAEDLAQKPAQPARPPTPMFTILSDRLSAAGIAATLEDEHLSFQALEPQGAALQLARPVAHPWIPERLLNRIGPPPEEPSWRSTNPWDFLYHSWSVATSSRAPMDSFNALEEANRRLERLLTSHVPQRLIEEANQQVQTNLSAYLEKLLPANLLDFIEPQSFSGQGVIAPGLALGAPQQTVGAPQQTLGMEQVGLPEKLAQALFGPWAQREGKAVAAVMQDAWVLVLRAPAITPNAFVALHPVLVPEGPAIRLNPQTAELLGADFDGDTVAVLLPLSEQAQQESGERLSVAAHLRRAPGLISALLPPANALWGLAWLSLGNQDMQAILAGTAAGGLPAPLTQDDLAERMSVLLAHDGPQAALQALAQLADIGYAAARQAGASFSPFAGQGLALPPQPTGNDAETWQAYTEAVGEQILSPQTYTDQHLGPQLLSAAIRSRGRRSLPILVGLRGVVTDASGQPVAVRHSIVQGLTPDEMFACVAGARLGLAELANSSQAIMGKNSLACTENPGKEPPRSHILQRARRAARPGIIFARAAANGESDPLKDAESRLLVGLPVP